ncbi:hypothetical protein DI273_30690 [Streptomyces violascens]|nr:hypothetical protein DI273_30690 [Streptomyces violascens]
MPLTTRTVLEQCVGDQRPHARGAAGAGGTAGAVGAGRCRRRRARRRGALVSRSMSEHRAVVLGSGPGALPAGLGQVERGVPGAGVITGAATVAGKVALVFPGQGSQWVGMGRELYASSPCSPPDRRVRQGAGPVRRLVVAGRAVRGGGAASLDRVDVVQPALWAVMVALAAVWESLGVRPDAVVGASKGEIAAAVVAGALSLEDGARVMALRSQVVRELSAGAACSRSRLRRHG